MRVIAGTAGSIRLKAPDGMGTRPTTDRQKETLFNILAPYIPGSRFLDLYSGSGAIGIEALSRGAAEAVFVENTRTALLCIQSNLLATKLLRRARVIPADVMRALEELNQEKKGFDLIFMDPPYQSGGSELVIRFLKDSSLLSEDGLVIFEDKRGTKTDFVEECNFTIDKIKKYKLGMHVFLRRKAI